MNDDTIIVDGKPYRRTEWADWGSGDIRPYGAVRGEGRWELDGDSGQRRYLVPAPSLPSEPGPYCAVRFADTPPGQVWYRVGGRGDWYGPDDCTTWSHLITEHGQPTWRSDEQVQP